MDVFTRDESVAHLLRHVPDLDPADARMVADALGNLPLAVEQASAWLEQTGMQPQAYVAELATQATRILALNQPSDYQTPVVATWNLSFERLQQQSPAAVRLLQLLAFFSPGPDLHWTCCTATRCTRRCCRTTRASASSSCCPG